MYHTQPQTVRLPTRPWTMHTWIQASLEIGLRLFMMLSACVAHTLRAVYTRMCAELARIVQYAHRTWIVQYAHRTWQTLLEINLPHNAVLFRIWMGLAITVHTHTHKYTHAVHDLIYTETSSPSVQNRTYAHCIWQTLMEFYLPHDVIRTYLQMYEAGHNFLYTHHKWSNTYENFLAACSEPFIHHLHTLTHTHTHNTHTHTYTHTHTPLTTAKVWKNLHAEWLEPFAGRNYPAEWREPFATPQNRTYL